MTDEDARYEALEKEHFGDSDRKTGIYAARIPAQCKHTRSLFIMSERGQRRAQAYVCKDCGTFVVWINGERLTFALVTDQQVEAAGRYAQGLQKDDQAE